MQFIKLITISALLATGLAAPNNKPSKPSKPQPPSGNQNANQCGNNVEPYCCNTDDKGQYTTCKAMDSSSTCSATIVCCNANDSIQLCLGNVNINLL